MLALTPARDYYGSHVVDGKDPSEQWNRKKQTKEQKRAAKKAKLDPANQKSALDVMKEREAVALKRKRGEEEDADEEGVDEAGADEVGRGGKQKKGDGDADAAEARRREKAERRKEKRHIKKERRQEKKAKAEAKKARKQLEEADEVQNGEHEKVQAAEEPRESDEMDVDAAESVADIEEMDLSGLADDKIDATNGEAVEASDDAASAVSSAPTTPLIDSPAFDLEPNHSAPSSSSSIVPPSTLDRRHLSPSPKAQTQSNPTVDTKASSTHADDSWSGISSPKIKLPDIDHDELQARLQKRIAELRAARKADTDEGKPAKSRQELLDQRRQKEEQRKATKKAQRQKAKEDEQRRREEQLRGSGSPLSTDIFSPREPKERENNFSFSRLAFDDGTSADPSLSTLQDPKKKKGPQDARTALQAAHAKQARLAGYDSTKQADIAEKDSWMNARRRAGGEKVRDDQSLLKKALKRKEKQKGKSEKEWKAREEGVVKGREMKQKKRENNLQKRREEKGGKGKKGKGKGPSGGGGKGGSGGGGGGKKGRPGFEGRFKA